MKLKKSVQVILGVVLGIVLVGIMSAVSGDDKPEAAAAETAASNDVISVSKTQPANEPAPGALSLFSSTVDFTDKFNALGKANDGFTVADLKITEGQVQNSFQATVNKYIGLIGSINKEDGTIKELTMIGQGDGTAQSGADILLCMSQIIEVADGSLTATQRGEIMRELKLMGDDAADLSDHSASTDKNGLHYFINTGSAIGVMFGVTKK